MVAPGNGPIALGVHRPHVQHGVVGDKHFTWHVLQLVNLGTEVGEQADGAVLGLSIS